MSCAIPFLKRKSDGSVVYVPCGKCLACRIDKRNEWTWRLLTEISSSDAVFLTLTIDDEHLDGPSLKKASVQRFMKRIRKALPERSFKYFFVGEYGEIGLRPHYHAIICGLSTGKALSYDFGDTEIVRRCWPFGFVKLEPASKGSIRYVLKYLDKMMGNDEFSKLYPYLLPPFRLMSKGIGRQFIENNFSELREHDGKFFFDGAWRPMPRYYMEKVFSPDELDARGRVVSKHKLDKIHEIMARYNFTAPQAVFYLGRQRLVNLMAKRNVDGKDIT